MKMPIHLKHQNLLLSLVRKYNQSGNWILIYNFVIFHPQLSGTIHIVAMLGPVYSSSHAESF
jgi:hypothetical protein